MRRTDVLPESPVQQHVPLWKMLPSPTTAYSPTGPLRGARFFFRAHSNRRAGCRDQWAASCARAEGFSRNCHRTIRKFCFVVWSFVPVFVFVWVVWWCRFFALF